MQLENDEKKEKKKKQTTNNKQNKTNNRTTNKEFLAEYEKLTDLIVPRSAEKILEDNDFILYRILLFSRVADDFKKLAGEHKYVYVCLICLCHVCLFVFFFYSCLSLSRWTVRPYRPDQKKNVDRKKLEADREKMRVRKKNKQT